MCTKKVLFLLPLVLLLAACTDAPVLQAPTLTAFLPEPTTAATPSAVPSQTATPPPTPTPTQMATSTPTLTPTAAPVVLIGAGDIAYCGEPYMGDEATAEIIARYPGAAVFTAGDNVYGRATGAEYRNCYGPSWGQFKDHTRPVPGNHDYTTDQGAPYYAYFGEAAGEAGQGFYSYDLGDWHLVGLNSNCNDISCRPNSVQAQWLREDLQRSQKRCTLLYWHHPRWSSGLAGSYGSVATFWKIAREFNAELVVSGNDHNYERFAPMDGDGNADPSGVRQFVVGTGGAELRDWGEIQPNSEARIAFEHGVIKFNLYPDRYEWEFIPVDPSAPTDSGSGACN